MGAQPGISARGTLFPAADDGTINRGGAGWWWVVVGGGVGAAYRALLSTNYGDIGPCQPSSAARFFSRT